MNRVVAALLTTALVLAPVSRWTEARADEAEGEARPRVEWNPDWTKFRVWEYFGTAIVQGASIYIRWYEPLPAEPKWTGGNAFDDTIRGWLVADTPEARQHASLLSDRLSYVGTAIPYAIDLPVALLVHRQVGLTWQLLMMDLEATAVSNFINNALFYYVGRGRPSTADCARNPNYDVLCGGAGNNASFPSGHTVTIATATGLTCVHHRHLPLYGHPAADAGVCIALAATTIATGALRVVADRHYTTDVLIGAAIGFGSGYGLPSFLHYRSKTPAVPPVAFVPYAGPQSLGLGVVGLL